jgi:hypothetical protein
VNIRSEAAKANLKDVAHAVICYSMYGITDNVTWLWGHDRGALCWRVKEASKLGIDFLVYQAIKSSKLIFVLLAFFLTVC